MIAPIIESTVAIFRAVKTNGRAVGTRTRRKMSISPAAYERISSMEAGRTEVSPRNVLTKTGKKQRTAAIAIFDVLPKGPNHAFVIGANAMIGTALAAIAYGISARPTRRQRASARAARIPSVQPIAKPPSASWKVNQPARNNSPCTSQKVRAIADGGG